MSKLIKLFTDFGIHFLNLYRYGSYHACDFRYQLQLKNLINKYLDEEVVLFTTDGAGDNYLRCGKIAGVLPAIDFGM